MLPASSAFEFRLRSTPAGSYARANSVPALFRACRSEEIGRIATQSLLNRLHDSMPPREEITVEPELVVRDSTGPVRSPR